MKKIIVGLCVLALVGCSDAPPENICTKWESDIMAIPITRIDSNGMPHMTMQWMPVENCVESIPNPEYIEWQKEQSGEKDLE